MSDESLTEEERQALDEVANQPGAAAAASPDPGTGAPASPRLGHQPRIVRTPLPGLDVIHESAARDFGVALSKFFAQSTTVVAAPASTEHFGEFTARQPDRSAFNVLSLKPLGANALLVVSPALLSLSINSLFGGSGNSAAEADPDRALYPSEQRIVERLVERFCAVYEDVWREVHPLKPVLLKTAIRASDTEIAAATDAVITIELTVKFAELDAPMFVVIPGAALESIREKLIKRGSMPLLGGDARARLLADQLKSVVVEVVAELASTRMTVSELLALKKGDFVAFDLHDKVVARVDAMPMLRCSYGISSNRYALRVTELLPQLPPHQPVITNVR